MAQVQNLVDMLRNNREDAQAKGVKPTDAKLSAKSGKAVQNLLPVDPTTAFAGTTAPKAKSGKGSPGTFQAKVEKSRAKLAAATAHKSLTQDKPAAKPDAPVAKTARKESAAKAGAGQPARPARPAPDRNDDAADASVNAVVAKTQPAATAADNGDDQQDQAAPALDPKSAAQLKKGLEDLGIEVDDAQLNDPAFLAEMLRMLQAMQSPEMVETQVVDAAASAVPGIDEDAGQPAVAADTEAKDMPAEDGKAQAAVQEKPLSRRELADLIANRLDTLKQVAGSDMSGAQVTAQAPTVTRKEWQGIQVRPRTESIGTEPLPMADLDRLRVMQTAAMQAAPNSGDAANTGADLSLETDNIDPVAESAGAVHAASEHDAAGGDKQDAKADLFGRNGEQTGNAEATARKEGPLVAREGATGPQFNQALEQARTVDHRSGIQHGMEPRMAGPQAGLLEQIAKKMSAVAHKAGDEVSIQLSPEHLGKVRVTLEMKEGGMSARIAVENDAVRQQVEANLSSLKDSLENQGIKLQGLEVSVDQRHSSLFNPDGSNSESFFHRRGQGGEGGDASGRDNVSFESAPESDTGRRMGYNTMEYIG